MKKKKIILQLTAIALIMGSCSNDESVLNTDATQAVTTSLATASGSASTSTYKVLDAASIPVSISKAIASQYPSGTVVEVSLLSTGEYSAIVSNSSTASKSSSRTKISFSSRGTISSTTTLTVVSVANLPTVITNYITANYVGATINSAHIESNGYYDVQITTAAGVATRVYFTSAGIYVSSSSSTTSSIHTAIAISSLLVDITNYITTTYPGSTITSAYTDTDGSFDVYITTAAGLNVKLYFTSAGVFVSASSSSSTSVSHTHTAVALSTLPAAISTYVTTNYAGATITLAYLESDGTYDVYITTTAGTSVKLDFTAAGVYQTSSSASTGGSGRH